MSFLGDLISGKLGMDLTKKAADKLGINKALKKAGINELGSFESALDPLDFAGTTKKREEQSALEEAEAEQLSALDSAQQELRRSTGIAQGFLEPFAGVGQQGVDQAGFLTDPQAQFDFLQNNPLFQLSLDNANRQTNQFAASRSRLSAGDTFEDLSNNVLLSAAPLIQGQKGSIVDLLNFGSGTSRAQSNAALGLGSGLSGLIQDSGNVQAAATAQNNAINQQQRANNQQLAITVASAFSDPKLKTNKKIIGEKNGFTLWSWDWNDLARTLYLTGSSQGVMADEVLSKMPEAVSYEHGFMKVNYSMVGV